MYEGRIIMKYVVPEVEILELQDVDVITVSGLEGGENTFNPGDGGIDGGDPEWE